MEHITKTHHLEFKVLQQFQWESMWLSYGFIAKFSSRGTARLPSSLRMLKRSLHPKDGCKIKHSDTRPMDFLSIIKSLDLKPCYRHRQVSWSWLFTTDPFQLLHFLLPHHWHRQNATKSQTSIVQLHPPWRLAQLRKLSQVWLWSGGHHIKWFHWYREVLHNSQLSGKWCAWDWFESEWNIRRDILYIPKWGLSTNTPGMERCGKETFSLI